MVTTASTGRRATSHGTTATRPITAGTWTATDLAVGRTESTGGRTERPGLLDSCRRDARRPYPVSMPSRSNGRSHMVELAPPAERAFLVAVDTGQDKGWT